ncbi:MAG TPA: hypothetical protein PKW49_13945, partial [Paludibacteraceae bacterium]|nr:hypothetical protein [Paludibacteraceae bacterium]
NCNSIAVLAVTASAVFSKFGHFVHYYTSLWTNGYKKQAVSPLFGVGYASGFLNGFTPEYVH